MPTILGGRFRLLLERRGLLMTPIVREECFIFMLDDGPIALDRHPTKVREALMIARAHYGEGQGEHGEMIGLYARREDLESPVDDPGEIVWRSSRALGGPNLNPGGWVRLDVWLDDQFLLEDALRMRYERDVG